MRFYRRLSHIKAISFDLDDTLYHNKPVMLAIEKKMVAYFSRLAVIATLTITPPKVFDYRFWSTFRHQAIKQQPDLGHDVVRLRLVTYQLGFKALGMNVNIAEQQARTALAYFISLRSDFKVPDASKKLLACLRLQYQLVAISNGNVDTKAIGLAPYFQHVYHAGWQENGTLLRQKPTGDMFAMVCQQLDIIPSQLLHVGDCGRADIQGAILAGCQAAWLSCFDVGKPITLIPHIELTELSQLRLLLT